MNSRKRPKKTLLSFFSSKVPKRTEDSEVMEEKREESSSAVKDEKTEEAREAISIGQSDVNTLSKSFSESNMDIGLFIGDGIYLDDCQKLKVLENSWKPDPSFSFPANHKKRKFQYHWFEKFPWLSYSAKLDGAFCKICVVFSNGQGGQGNQRLGKLVLSPFSQWKDALACFTSHQMCQYHKNYVIMAEEFKKIMKGQNENIEIQLHQNRNAEICKNRLKLLSVIKTVIVCGRQGFALRGHRDSGNISVEETGKNEGNFRALLRFRLEASDKAEDLKEIQSGMISKKYTSPDIQNEIIKICGKTIQDEIVEKVNNARCFAVLADETTDISGKEVLTLCVRYIEESDSSCIIREDFLDFIEIENLSGANIADTILSNLKKLGIDISYLRGQGYDGAASMSGKLNGVQAKILQVHPAALYVHCCNHVLNLVLSKSCVVPSIRNSLATIQEIVTYFRASPKRRKILKSKLLEEEFLNSKNTSRKTTCLKKFCETRWVERHEAIFTFCECLEPILSTLLEITEDATSETEASKKAMLFYNALCQSSFLVSLFVAEKCFSITHNLSIALQKPDIDLISSYEAISDVTEIFRKMRENSKSKFSAIFERASEVAKDLNLEIKKPRLLKKQMHRDNTPSESAEDYYRKTIFIPFMDFVIQNMIDRFENHKNIVTSLYAILPKYIEKSSVENIMQCAEFYSSDIKSFPNILQAEIEMWFEKWLSLDKEERPSTAIESLSKCNANVYPNIKKLLKVLSTLPVSTATPERTFSTLRQLKTYLRNSMSNSRLSGLALMNIHQEIKLNAESILNTMASNRTYLVL